MRETSCTSLTRGSALCRRPPAETSVGCLPCGIRVPHGDYLIIWSYTILKLIVHGSKRRHQARGVSWSVMGEGMDGKGNCLNQGSQTQSMISSDNALPSLQIRTCSLD